MKYRFTNEETRASWHGDNLFYGVQLTESEYISSIEKITNQDIKRICDHVFNIPKMSIYTFGNYQQKNELHKKLQKTILSTSLT
jgi:predicted Zn-dependent peptidase